MNRSHLMTTLIGLLGFFPAQHGYADEPVNYLNLDHEISTETLRAGNHDPSGDNVYYFKADAYALIISKEELELDLEKRKKIPLSLGEYGDFAVKSLSNYTSDPAHYPQVSFKGDQIRSLVAETMNEFKVREEEVAVKVVITMFERAKKFGFWGQDTLVGKAEYFAVPETLPRKPRTQDLTLQITDNKGTFVTIGVKYNANVKLAKGKS